MGFPTSNNYYIFCSRNERAKPKPKPQLAGDKASTANCTMAGVQPPTVQRRETKPEPPPAGDTLSGGKASTANCTTAGDTA